MRLLTGLSGSSGRSRKYKFIMALRIRVNKNIEKGSDFGHWASRCFCELGVDFNYFKTKGTHKQVNLG